MATVSNTPSGGLEKLHWYIANQAHSVWDHFNSDAQRAMVEDDLMAGKRVSMVLISLITAGMLLSMVTLAAVLAGL